MKRYLQKKSSSGTQPGTGKEEKKKRHDSAGEAFQNVDREFHLRGLDSGTSGVRSQWNGVRAEVGRLSRKEMQEKNEGEGELDTALESRVRGTLSGGSPLPQEARESLESKMGADFGDVRIHSGNRASELARDLNARAFTHGNHIVFGEGEYSPGTEGGRRLLSHELAHTMQQGAALRRVPGENWVQDRNGGLYYDNEAQAERRRSSLQRRGGWGEYRITSFLRGGTRYYRVEMRNPTSGDTQTAHQTGSGTGNNRRGADQNRNNVTINRNALSGTVGIHGNNSPGDIRIVQSRLNALGYLSNADLQRETPADNVEHIATNQLLRTIEGISTFVTRVGRGRWTNTGLIAPGSEQFRLLIRPELPVHSEISPGASVGRGGRNHIADVMAVQDRLVELGFLTAAQRNAEAPRLVELQIPQSRLTQTIRAIVTFQQTAVGTEVTGSINPGSLTLRVLNDPTHGTLTTINRNATTDRGAIPENQWGQVQERIIRAIEGAESARSSGEVPAAIKNAAGTPASFGRAQVIGATALGVIGNSRELRNQYDISTNEVRNLRRVADNTTRYYREVYHHSRGLGANYAPANINARFGAYYDSNGKGERIFRETGLTRSDLHRMYYYMAFYRILQAHPGNRGQATLLNLYRQDDSSLRRISNFLGFDEGTFRSYIRRGDRFYGENKQAYVTKSLFLTDSGQKLRNAMTDNSGKNIGRTLIHQNYNMVVGRVRRLRATLTARQVAAVTMRVHNEGPGRLTNFIQNINQTLQTPYVIACMRHYQ